MKFVIEDFSVSVEISGITFPALTMLDFVTMMLPLCDGGALLTKAYVKRAGSAEQSKAIK